MVRWEQKQEYNMESITIRGKEYLHSPPSVEKWDQSRTLLNWCCIMAPVSTHIQSNTRPEHLTDQGVLWLPDIKKMCLLERMYISVNRAFIMAQESTMCDVIRRGRTQQNASHIFQIIHTWALSFQFFLILATTASSRHNVSGTKRFSRKAAQLIFLPPGLLGNVNSSRTCSWYQLKRIWWL